MFLLLLYVILFELRKYLQITSKLTIFQDENRVNKRFKEAVKNNLLVENKSLLIKRILEHLVNGPIIILTNAKLLCCDICKFNKVSSELRKCLPWPITYQGHYIVLCGYDLSSQKVYYRNPSFSDRKYFINSI